MLNRILSEPHGKKYAVIVNEFGEIGIDNDLIVNADEEVFEMNNGCVCCTVRGDLIRIIEGLMRRKGKFDAIIVETTGLADPAPVAQTFFVDEEVFEMNNGCICCTVRGDLIRIIEGLMRRKGKFDAIIVETTGLADPAPVAQTFFVDENVGRKTRLDAVVTVADAKWLKDRLKDAPEAKNQIAFADVILLNKTDLVTDAELREVEARIRAINPYAKLHRTQRSQIPLSEILGRNAFDLDRILDIEPEFLHAADEHDHHHDHGHDHGDGHHHHHDHGGLKHYHDEDMQSFSLKTDKPLSPDKFFPWIQKLVAEDGPAILRCKGILNFKDDPDRFVFQGVHMILDGDHQRAWKDGEKRDSKLVFIGRQLPEEKIRKGFETVVA